MEQLTIKISDILIVLATLVGPIAAVQVQKFIEAATERRQRKLQIFRVLMATRAARLSVEHVNAVNSIELEFGPSKSLLHRQTNADKRVIEAYRIYFDRLCDQVEQTPNQLRIWHDRCNDLFVDLLHEMSKSSGYNFDKANLRRAFYHPKGHVDIEANQNILRDYFAKVALGQASIPMRLVDNDENQNESK